MQCSPPDARELPDGLDYVNAYVSQDIAQMLVRRVDAAPWRTDLKRRVQHYGYRYDYKARRVGRKDALGALPAAYQALAERLVADGDFDLLPDQVIVNEYLPGQGISAHIDCVPCFGDTIASLSLLSACVMRFVRPSALQQMDLHLQPESLLVLRGAARHFWTHAIPARKTDVVEGRRHWRSRRISLTFRRVTLSD